MEFPLPVSTNCVVYACIFSKNKTETVFFLSPSQKKVVVDGDNCMAKHWKFVTYKQDYAGTWILAKEGIAKLDGTGKAMVHVDQDLVARLGIVQE
uniref:Uncharacterized protein n=1 Tax=Ditylenchus dipsaci TaxID=166011 RepID=A0A915CP70_9BILA